MERSTITTRVRAEGTRCHLTSEQGRRRTHCCYPQGKAGKTLLLKHKVYLVAEELGGSRGKTGLGTEKVTKNRACSGMAASLAIPTHWFLWGPVPTDCTGKKSQEKGGGCHHVHSLRD